MEKLTNNQFSWGDKFFAESVSPMDVDKVRNYIRNQEARHKKSTSQKANNNFFNDN